MFKVIFLLSLLSVGLAQKGGRIEQQRQTDGDTEGSLGPESIPFLAPPPAPAPEPAGAGPDLDALWGPPQPYAFGYETPDSDGRSSRSETSDGRKVTGSYSLVGADGINRIVNYVADGDGFRASIITNEPGTERQNPSGIIMETSQPKAEEIARAFGPVAEPGPDAPRKYIGAPIPALPSFESIRRAPANIISEGSASPAFDAQVKDESFEQQKQTLSPAPLPAPAPAPAPVQQVQQVVQPAPLPVQLPQATKSFSQQIVHSIPAPAPVQQVVAPAPVQTVQQVIAPAPTPVRITTPAFNAVKIPTPAFNQVRVSTPIAQNIFTDYQPVIEQEIPRLAPLPATVPLQLPQATKSFSQQIVHSIPAPAPVQQVVAPAPVQQVIAPAPTPVRITAPTFNPIKITAPAVNQVRVSTPIAQNIVTDYQPVIEQEIPRIAPLPKPTLVVRQQPTFISQPQPTFFRQQPAFLPQPQPAFIPQPQPAFIPQPQPALFQQQASFIAQPLPAAQPIPAPRPVVVAPAPVPVQPISVQPISSGSLNSGVKSAASSSFGSIKSGSSPSAAVKGRLLAPTRVGPVVRVAPRPVQITQASLSPAFPTKTAAASNLNGKVNGQRVLKPFFITTTQAPLPARFEQIKDVQEKDSEGNDDQFFRS